MSAIGLHLTKPDWDETALQVVASLGGGLSRTICIARALIENGRIVDLVGLDRGVGLFCAKALDLPHEQGRSLRTQLIELRTEIERLTEAIRVAGDP